VESNQHFAMRGNHPLLLGLVLIFALTWPIDLARAAQSHERLPFHVPEFLGLLVGYGVAGGAVLAMAFASGWSGMRALLARLLIWRVGIAWYVVALLGPWALAGLALWIDGLFDGQPGKTVPLIRQIVPPTMNLWAVAAIWLVWEVLTNGEEIGWQGYVLPGLLSRFDARVATLALGTVRAIWHLPKSMMGGVQGVAHQSYPWWLFVIYVMSFTVLVTWVYVNTRGSLLLATFLHAANNTAMMCLPIAPGGRPFLIVTCFQCVLAVVVGWKLKTDLTLVNERAKDRA